MLNVLEAPEQYPFHGVSLTQLVRLPHAHTAIDRCPDRENYLREWHNERKKSIDFYQRSKQYSLKEQPFENKKRVGSISPPFSRDDAS
jgi:hypothetical protein